MTEMTIRERLNLCGIKRTFIRAQQNRLDRETEQALMAAQRLGSPSLTITDAARLAGVSRSVAYSRYLADQGGDDADRSGSSAVEDGTQQGQRGQVRPG